MIYIHIPFCRSFCTYCDFYSEVPPVGRKPSCNVGGFSQESELFEVFTDTVCEEILCRSEEIIRTGNVNTIYIGGGTPSLLPPVLLHKIVGTVKSVLGSVPGGRDLSEFTIEVNPEDIVEKGEAYVEKLLAMGVNRISMGVQSFDDKILRWMNRRHDSASAMRAYSILRNAGVRNISVDLIYGFPLLSHEKWRETISKALTLGNAEYAPPDHISAYQLSLEEHSTLTSLAAKGLFTEASDTYCEQQYRILCEMLGAAGYDHYEISNFARPGFEARHNSAYWRGVPYVGIGPAAHSLSVDHSASGDDRRRRSFNSDSITGYTSDSEVLTRKEIITENIMLSLRTSRGIDSGYLSANSDASVIDALLKEGKLAEFNLPVPENPSEASGSEDAAAELEESQSNIRRRIRIPEDYFFISDEIIRDLI